MKVKITTTQDMIDKSKQTCPSECVIAEAINALRPKRGRLRVYASIPGREYRLVTNKYLKKKDHDPRNHEMIPLPRAVRAYIDRFDKDKARVRPTTFIIDMPDWVTLG